VRRSLRDPGTAQAEKRGGTLDNNDGNIACNADGQLYIQHRGGQPGFLRVFDEHTLTFVDFSDNRHFISRATLSDNLAIWERYQI
jgi:predicted pyridoxine 5'-phosphate oxidase superfamily flavin-nucleotide-binding protein